MINTTVLVEKKPDYQNIKTELNIRNYAIKTFKAKFFFQLFQPELLNLHIFSSFSSLILKNHPFPSFSSFSSPAGHPVIEAIIFLCLKSFRTKNVMSLLQIVLSPIKSLFFLLILPYLRVDLFFFTKMARRVRLATLLKICKWWILLACSLFASTSTKFQKQENLVTKP